MNKYFIRYLALLPMYVILQVMVLNEILFSEYINPFLYLVLIISLPLKTPKWFLLIYAFILGLSIDIFSGILGFHSTASILIAFLKSSISKITIPYNILSENDEITLTKVGNKAFVTFSLFLILIHNSCLFIIQHLEFNFLILGKIISSSLVTLVIILISQLFNNDK